MSKESSSKLVQHFDSSVYSKGKGKPGQNDHLRLDENDFMIEGRKMQKDIYNPNLMELYNINNMSGVVGARPLDSENVNMGSGSNQMSSSQMLASQRSKMNSVGMMSRPLGMIMQRPLPYKIPFQPQVVPNPAVQQQIDKAFDDAFHQANSWANEYQASNNRVTEDVSNAQPSRNQPPSSDQLAKTAGALASLISASENQKFKNSKFLQMMEQLRDGEVGIEGDKLVQQIAPVSNTAGISIPNNFGISQQSADAMATDALIAEFQRSQPDSEIMDRNINNQIPSSHQMAQQFLAENNGRMAVGAWEETMQAPPRNYNTLDSAAEPGQQNLSQQNQSAQEWSKAFQERKAAHVPVEQISEQYSIPVSALDEEMRNRYSPDVSHDLDWTEDFKAMDLERDSKLEQELYQNDAFIKEQERRAEKLDMQEAEQQWRELQKQYDLANPTRTFVEGYSFFPNNPYLQLPVSELSNPVYSSTLTESILALEATVTKDPENALAWFELGIKQQENENESSAIAALQKAIEIDPSNINSYLAIAVSYTNENYTVQAQDALADWMRKHPIYSRLPFVKNIPSGLTSSENHEALTSVYVQAAMHSGTEVDADVQSALGVLFNINHDFAKAIDCFQTAVSVRPTDFQIWNKLGATLANSGEPEKAMEAYYNALQINQNYIRARYNLAIACMQIGQYQEAATHLLTALQIQEKSMHHVIQKSTPELLPEMRLMHSGQSESVWSALRVLLSTYVGREDLVAACDAKDMTAFREDFEF